jgi:hypothetical protein
MKNCKAAPLLALMLVLSTAPVCWSGEKDESVEAGVPNGPPSAVIPENAAYSPAAVLPLRTDEFLQYLNQRFEPSLQDITPCYPNPPCLDMAGCCYNPQTTCCYGSTFLCNIC